MLNEKLEYDEYTCRISDSMPMRLNYINITNGLTGVSGAQTIIAREAIYGKKLSRKAVNDILNAWCGFETASIENSRKENPELFLKLNGWLSNYLENMESIRNAKGETTKQIEAAKSELAKKQNNWNSDPLSGYSGNDEDAIIFGRIIADAIDQGPLRERYLVLEKDILSCLPKRRGPSRGDGNRLLKALAYCCCYEGKRRKLRVNPRLANWIGEKSKGLCERIVGIEIQINNERQRVFEGEYLDDDRKDRPRIILSEEVKEYFKPRVVTGEEAEQLNKAEKKYYIYEDRGCTEPLRLYM